MAKVAKGEKREYETAVVLWIDLLGYGSMLQKASWDPTSPLAKTAVDRIVEFQRSVAAHSMRHFPSFVMNDGAIAYRDLSPRSRSPTFDFLRRAHALHSQINAAEREKGFPGARSVLAVGLRVRRAVDYSRRLNDGEGLRVRQKLKAGEISTDQAVSHALMARHHYDSTPELQHNYALTKAYLADASGTGGGLGGPNMFVDRNVFGHTIPSWISYGPLVNWSDRGISGQFLPLQSIDISKANACQHDGVLDAFDAINAIYPDTEVLKSVKSSRIGDLRGSTGGF